ncbi:hypothetical protein C0993_010835, partial [Termitomyces sp. T159_Od127]
RLEASSTMAKARAASRTENAEIPEQVASWKVDSRDLVAHHAMIDIPQDLIIQIIDLLGEDAAALKACSLVSSSFRDHSQRHLFRSITLDFKHPSQQILLHEAFMSNPALPDFVLYLEVILLKCRAVAAYDVLRQLHRVRGVTLDPDYDDFETRWKDLHIQTRDSLTCVICLPTCQYLSLGSNIYFPREFLVQLTHLRHFHFTCASSLISHHQEDTDKECHPQLTQGEGFLESLGTFNYMPSTLELLRSPAPLPLARLRRCFLQTMLNPDLQALFDLCPLLEMVHLNVISSFPSVNFSSLEYLRAVCINASSKAGSENLARALVTLPSISQLRLCVPEDVMTKEQWSSVDRFLAQEGDDHHNKKLRPRVVWYPEYPPMECESLLKEKLPRLVEKGMVESATADLSSQDVCATCAMPFWTL